MDVDNVGLVHFHDTVLIATYYDAFVFGLAFVNALDDESEAVNLVAFDRRVVVFLPGDVITENVVDASERIGAGLRYFAGPKLYLFSEKQYFFILATYFSKERIAAT